MFPAPANKHPDSHVEALPPTVMVCEMEPLGGGEVVGAGLLSGGIGAL